MAMEQASQKVDDLKAARGKWSSEEKVAQGGATGNGEELEGFRSAIQSQLRTIGELVKTSHDRYLRTAPLFLEKDWYPYMVALYETYETVAKRWFSPCTTHDPLRNEKNALADLSLLCSIENCIQEKNSSIDKQLQTLQSGRYQPFESQKSECTRKVGEILQINHLRLCLDEVLLGRVPLDAKKRMTNVTFFVVMGIRYLAGDLTDSDISGLMPTIADEHHDQLSIFGNMGLLYGGELKDFLPNIHSKTSEEGTKMIEEMLVMIPFLLMHGRGQYSTGWRKLQLQKLEELRPIIKEGCNTIQTREAMGYLHHNYYRMRAAYERIKEKLETVPKFDRGAATGGV